MTRYRLRRPQLLLALVLALGLFVAACGGGGAQNTGCDHWCGNGSATVTMAGATTTISGGGCYDVGAAGVDVRFGDWQGLEGLSSYLMLVTYRAGGPTAAATPTPAPSAHLSPNIIGSINGKPFILGDDAVVALSADGTGSFSGTDVNGYGAVKGKFTCGS
jgi:hypothetical protein